MKKKILFVIESFAIGGAEKSLVNLLNTLDFSGHEVTVVIFAKGGALENQLPGFINLIHHQHHFSLMSRLKFLVMRKVFPSKQSEDQFWKVFASEVPKITENFDVAIAYGQGFPTHFVSDKVVAVKKLAWVNTDYLKAGYNADFDAPSYQKMDSIVTVSEAGKTSFEQAFRNTNIKAKVDVIEDLLGIAAIKKLAGVKSEISKFEGLKLVTVGRLHPAKGFNLAIDAAEALKKEGLNFKWWIVGEGAERLKLEKLISEKKLAENFILLGADTNPYKFINAADIYVQTSVYEGFSITVREAKALGKPIVTTNFPSVFNAVSDGVDGIITNMNGKDIANAIFELYQSFDTKIINIHSAQNVELAEEAKKHELTRVIFS